MRRSKPNAPRKKELKLKKKILRKKAVARYKKSITVPDAEIMPKTILKKRQRSNTCSIALSGKKKRKILNHLRREEKIKSNMDTSSSPRPRPKKQEAADVSTDVQMDELS